MILKRMIMMMIGEEPTFYDSGMWAGDCSFDLNNEANPIVKDRKSVV